MLIDVTNPITDWIFPRRCLICEEDLAENDLCISCLSLITKCPDLCSIIDSANISIFYYELIIKKLVIRSKFNNSLIHAHRLMNMVRSEIARAPWMNDVKQFAPQAVSFVPTHWLNRAIRGVELSYLFAEILADELGVAVVSLLRRYRFRDRQVLRKSRRERRDLIHGAFGIRGDAPVFERLLLVDDIVTTGATFDETKKVLKTIAGQIRCVAIAKTP